ncbi:MAG: hypothetical protein JSS16_07965 [Proteobacteria bacterium]|nr:hypothetical protein [Pseudomonadota bacterium]
MLSHAPVAVVLCTDSAPSWFRSVEGRRYRRHLLWLVVLKIVLLAAIYLIFVAPQPRADTSPDQVYDAIRGAPAAAAPASQPAGQRRGEPAP